MGKTGRRARLCGVAALGVAALAASTAGALNGGLGDLASFGKNVEEIAALEEAFFETLGRCESPLLVERNEAEDALFERFAEFEAIWQDRRFLTNGEIAPEARQRFELAEARYREKTREDCVAAFETTFETGAPEIAEGGTPTDEEKKGEKKENGENGENAGNSEEARDGGVLRGRVCLRWERPLRIVYLSPDWNAFERRDADGKRWRPSGRFSAPELAPEFDATELTLETVWERVDDGEETTANDENGESWKNAENGGGETTVVGVFEGLIGGDFRVWLLPLGRVAVKNAEIGEDKRNERKETGRETAADRGDCPSVFQSGDAVATVGETTINKNGETTVRVRFDFAEAFDAFDSHRVWFDKEDFALIIDDGDGKTNIVADRGVLEAGNEPRTATKAGKEAKTGAEGRRRAPVRLRVRERSATGALFELDFPNDAALREAVAAGRARLAGRIPRFLFWTRFEVEGTEKRNDDNDFNEGNDEKSGSAANG